MTLPEHYEVKVTDEQRANLIKLADRLGGYEPPPHFSMAAYMLVGRVSHWVSCVPTDLEVYNECHTVACAVGHGPYIGIPGLDNERWEDYAKRVFGASTDYSDADIVTAGFGINDYWLDNRYHSWKQERMALWVWCFSGNWAMTDNTPQGAAARIRYALENGVPYNYQRIAYGYETIPYTIPNA